MQRLQPQYRVDIAFPDNPRKLMRVMRLVERKNQTQHPLGKRARRIVAKANAKGPITREEIEQRYRLEAKRRRMGYPNAAQQLYIFWGALSVQPKAAA